MKILMLIIIFFCIGAFFIISQNNLALKELSNREKFVSLYGKWVSETFESIGSLTVYVIKMEWLPE